jgi:hypothetical protein
MHPAQGFQHGAISLEHEVITVLRAAEALADGVIVYVRVKNEIHGIPSWSGHPGDSTS